MKTPIFEDLRQSLHEARQIRKGTLKPSRVFRIDPETYIVKVRENRGGSSKTKFPSGLVERGWRGRAGGA